MTRMAQERDSILRIRAKIDAHDEMEEAKATSNETLGAFNDADDRIQLCSREKPVRVQRLMGNISSELPVKYSLAAKLAKFLHANSDGDITVGRLNNCSVCVSISFVILVFVSIY